MKIRKFSRKVVITTVGITAVAGVGIAMAVWSANGAGPGRATSLSAQSTTITATTGAADLYPGFAAGDIFFTVTNPNPYPVTFTSFSHSTITSSDAVACPISNITVNDAPAINFTVAANATNEPHTIADVVGMVLAAPDGCQNKQFTITLALVGSQS